MSDAICPRCRQVPAATVTIGLSTFCASCVASIENLIVAHVPPVAQTAPVAEAPAEGKRGRKAAAGEDA